MKYSEEKQSPQNTHARKGRRSKDASNDEALSEHVTGAGIAESELEFVSGRRELLRLHDEPSQPQTRPVKKPLLPPPPSPLLPIDTDNASSIARKSRNINKKSAPSESKKRALKEDGSLPVREKRVRTAPSKLSD